MHNVNTLPWTSTYISTYRFMTVSSQQFQTSFMILICDANRPIFQNYVQPSISPHKLASAPVLPPMRSRSGSKYAFGNQHMSNCQHVDVFIVREFRVKIVVTQRANYFTSSSEIHLGLRISAHELHNELLPPIYISSVLLETAKGKKQGQPENERHNKWQLLSYLTHFQVHILMIHVQWSMQLIHVICACSFDSGWDTLLARNACSYMEKHLSTAVMSASSILLLYLSFYPNPTSHPSAKTQKIEDPTRAEVITADRPTVYCIL